MIKYDSRHPDGIKYQDKTKLDTLVSPVTVRQITDEERQRINDLPRRPSRSEMPDPVWLPKDWGEV